MQDTRYLSSQVTMAVKSSAQKLDCKLLEPGLLPRLALSGYEQQEPETVSGIWADPQPPQFLSNLSSSGLLPPEHRTDKFALLSMPDINSYTCYFILIYMSSEGRWIVRMRTPEGFRELSVEEYRWLKSIDFESWVEAHLLGEIPLFTLGVNRPGCIIPCRHGRLSRAPADTYGRKSSSGISSGEGSAESDSDEESNGDSDSDEESTGGSNVDGGGDGNGDSDEESNGDSDGESNGDSDGSEEPTVQLQPDSTVSEEHEEQFTASGEATGQSQSSPLITEQERADIGQLATLLENKDYDRILSSLEIRLGEINPGHDRGEFYSSALKFLYALTLGKKSLYSDALEHFSALVDQGSLMQEEKDFVSFQAASCAFQLKKYELAARYYEQSLNIETSRIAPLLRMAIPDLCLRYSRLALARYRLSQPAPAIEAYNRAVGVENAPPESLFHAYFKLGNLYYEMNAFRQALHQYKIAMRIAQHLKDKKLIGWIHCNLGSTYLSLNNQELALTHFKQSLELTLEHEPSDVAVSKVYNNLGTVYQSLGDFPEARRHYETALEKSEAADDCKGKSMALGNLGNLSIQEKSHQDAIEKLSRLLDLNPDLSIRLTALHNRGVAYHNFALERWESVRQCSGDSENTADATPVAPLLLQVHPPAGSGHNGAEPSFSSCADLDIVELFEKAAQDLQSVITENEKTIQGLRGNTRAESLIVNAMRFAERTYHLRIDSLMVGLGEWQAALECAESLMDRAQSEMTNSQQATPVHLPMKTDAIESAVRMQQNPVMSIIFTGYYLHFWGFWEQVDGELVASAVSVRTPDNHFMGKNFDQFIKRYACLCANRDNEPLEVSQAIDLLDRYIAAPIAQTLGNLGIPMNTSHPPIDLIIITDDYVRGVPFSVLSWKGMSFMNTLKINLKPSIYRFSLGQNRPAPADRGP